ncbi:hypothetical protein PVL29_006246 [Vitis rotundifolia]|uniref:Uncharacterized protein n=1 Tax=Vitis rotundifolia TaxID=103349 RepID=A0AA39A6M4_VITRO|nr:hypothetical protein PVL29_006246 [Vitis rotundifolia]
MSFKNWKSEEAKVEPIRKLESLDSFFPAFLVSLPILKNHKKSANTIPWSPTLAHLLASARMDHIICIWNAWNRDQKEACEFSYHDAAVKDVGWRKQEQSSDSLKEFRQVKGIMMQIRINQ